VGKRSDFERVMRDFYPTPVEAVRPLLPHLPPNVRFCEPCAGNGALIDHLTAAGHYCGYAFDIDPQRSDIGRGDATMPSAAYGEPDYFITNPPWTREVLHQIILNLSRRFPTWLLFDADWMHTKQSAPFMPYLRKIVSVGRVKWIPDSPFTGKDNCCWYLFDQTSTAPAQFVGRAA
jgi:hypothetical protein